MTAKLTALQELQIQLMRHYGPKEKERGNEAHYMSFDPGEGTGWALWSENGYLTDFGNVYNDVDGVFDLLGLGIDRDLDSYGIFNGRGVPKVVIYEKWKLLKTKEFYGSTLLSSQVVGVIRGFARGVGAERISNETNIKSTAANWTGLKPVGSHATQHFIDAIYHGWYYLQSQNKVTPRLMWNEPGGM